METRLNVLAKSIRKLFVEPLSRIAGATGQALRHGGTSIVGKFFGARKLLIAASLIGASGYLFYSHPPLQQIDRGETGIRVNQLTGSFSQWNEGAVIVLPGLHRIRVFSMRDQTHRSEAMSRAQGPAPVQSIEGLSLGVDIAVRYAIDPAAGGMWKSLPVDTGNQVVEPALQGIAYRVLARYTVREIFSTKRAEIQQSIETELKSRLAVDGLVLRNVQIGNVDLPQDYKHGMEGLLAEELASEKMRYTLELKGKRVRESELDAEAEKVRREKAAEAAGREQIIAARAQEEAMKHVLPFKQRQIEQRKLEAEAETQTRVRLAEANAQARRVEANGEADARQRLAEAEVFRLERVGKATSEQMSREGALIAKHPLLIQKALADKLSDKVQVIIAAPPSDGGFIGANLLGQGRREATPVAANTVAAANPSQVDGERDANGER
jgi:regulator of protease activity HflC (stomatin/prohibitin superfamily)